MLDEIYEITQKYQDHHVVWTGDMNGSLIRNSNKQDQMFNKSAKAMQLSPPLELSTMTYHHFNGTSQSQIDYILCSPGMRQICSQYGVLSREATNVSTHDPVMAEFHIPLQIMDKQQTQKKATQGKPNWKKADLLKYFDITHQAFEDLKDNAQNYNTEDLVTRIESILCEAASSAIPRPKARTRPRNKPWSPKLTKLIKEEKECFWQWKQEGRPTSPKKPTFIKWKKQKRIFRQEQRKLAAAHRVRNQKEIMEAEQGDPSLFHKLVKKQRGTTGELPDEMVVNNIVRSGDQLPEAMAEYFKALATPKDLPHYDQQTKERSDTKNNILQQIYKSHPIKIMPTITPQVIMDIITEIRKNKSPDPRGIMIEHIINASPRVADVLATLYNKILQEQAIPTTLKTGCITPVFKKKGSPRDPDNYRRITITVMIKKILEKILLHPVRSILNPKINNLQRGFTAGSSATNTALLLSEALAEKKDLKQPAYVLFLDASKAFDVVYHNGMLNSLHDLHITGDLWMILNNAYEGITSTLKWKGTITQPFEEGLGMRQGDYVSPDLFRARGNHLLDMLENAGTGMHIGRNYVGAPTCADDIALIADTDLDLQTMAHTAWRESTEQRYQYSTKKSKMVIFNQKQRNKIPSKVEMNNTEIETSTQEPHVGIQRTEDGKANATIEERIKSARRANYALMGVGMTTVNTLHPRTSLKLIRSYIIPTLTHSLETIDVTDSNIQKLGVFIRGTYRRIQNLPQETACCAIHILLGTLPIEGILDAQVLGLFVRVLNLENAREKDIVIRQLAVKGKDSASWTQKVRRTLWKYDLPSAYELVTDTPKKGEWKRKVRQAIQQYWAKHLKQQATAKKTLKFLNTDAYTPGKLHPIWETVDTEQYDIKRAQIKSRLVTGRYLLREDEARYRKTDPSCQLCKSGAVENLQHFLLECPTLETARKGYMNKLTETIANLTQLETTVLKSKPEMMMQFILDCSRHFHNKPNNDDAIRTIESISRKLCFALHIKRSTRLNTDRMMQKQQPTPDGGCTEEKCGYTSVK